MKYQNISLDNVYIELLSECNLRCKHCYNSSGRDESMINKESITKIIEKVESLNCKRIILSGGEPLLHPDIWNVLDFIKSKNMSVTLVSNGTLIDSCIAKRISQYDNIDIQISIDGPSSDIHDKIRGNGSLKKSINGIKYLQNYGMTDKIKLYFCINKKNKEYVDKMLEFTKSLGLKHITYNFVLLNGRGRDNEDILYLSNKEKYDLCELLIKKREENKDITIKSPSPISKCPLVYESDEVMKVPLKINFYGDMYLCSIFDNNKKFSIGNIYTNDILKLNDNYKLVKLINFMKNLFEYNDNCIKCMHKTGCTKCCPAVVLAREDILSSTDGLCDLRKKYFKLR